MFGLQRIVLHHSYLPNKSTAIECAGNTNISGDNGTGKTSALNLIPIFFGEQSDRLVSRAGGKKDFLDYYLPTSASLIGFDYLREDGPKCVVLYRIQRSEGARLAYRFIDSDFASAFLTDALKPKLLQGLAVTEAIAEVTQSGIDVSNQLLTVMDYRAVIQQDERLLKRGGRVQKALKATAKRFCLGRPSSKMSHIDRLTYAILKRSSMFSRLKSMIADTFFEDIALGDKPEHFKNPELIDNIQHIRSFLEHRPQFQRCIQTASDRVRIAIQIHQFKQALEQAITEQRRVQHDLENELEALKTSHSHLENERDDSLQKYQSEVKDHKDTCGRFERELNLLHQQKAEWEERNITYKISELEALADYQEQYQQALEHWRQLKEGTQKPDSERVESKQLAAEAFEQQKQRTDDKIDKLKEQLSELEQQGAKAREQILLDKHEHHQTLMQTLETEHSTHLTELNKAQWQLDQMQPSEEERIQQEAINQQIEQLEHQIDLKDSQRDEVLSKQQGAKTAYSQAVEQLEDTEQRLNHIKSLAQQLQQQLYPADGSLLSALRAQDPKWGQGIGKILPQSLLYRQDLAPDFVKDQNNGSILGWTLNLEAIDLPSYAASEAALLAELAEIESKQRVAQQALEQQHKKTDKVLKAYKASNQSLDQFDYDVDQLKQQLKTLKVNKKTLWDEIQTALQQRKQQLQQEITAYETAYKAFKKQRQTRIDALNNDFEEQLQNVKANFQITAGDLQQQLHHLKDQLHTQRTQYQQQLEDIEAQYSEQCRKQGVDPERIRQAHDRAEALKGRIHAINDSQNEVFDYRAWVTRNWQRRDELEASLCQAKESLLTAQEQLSQQQQAFKHKLKRIKDNIGQRQTQAEQLRINLLNADDLNQNTKVPPLNPGNESPTQLETKASLSDLIQRLKQLNQQHYALYTEVLQGMDQAIKVIQKYPNTPIYESWQNLTQLRQNKGENPIDTHFRLNQTQDLEAFLEQWIPQIQNAQLETLFSVGNGIAQYYGSLKRLNEQVAQVSSKLKTRLNTDQTIDSLSNITISLKSRIEDEECWTPLKTFTTEWGHYLNQHQNSSSTHKAHSSAPLPPDYLMAALKDALDTLKQAKISKNLDSLIEMHLTMSENQRPVVIRSDADFNNMSSNGLSYLAICVVFMAMCRYLCPDKSVQLTWPVDELASLSPTNIQKLFNMMAAENIWMFSAFPSSDPNLLRFFEHRNFIDKAKGVRLIAAEDQSVRQKLASKFKSQKTPSSSEDFQEPPFTLLPEESAS